MGCLHLAERRNGGGLQGIQAVLGDGKHAGMTRWLGHMLAVLCMVASPSLLSAQNPDSLLWGPQPGEITVSLAAHAMTWHTANLDLWLDPWLTFRHVAGTAANAGTDEGRASWDNLRGASFGARLDGRWVLEGSLEELQGLPSAWDGLMTVSYTHLTLPTTLQV